MRTLKFSVDRKAFLVRFEGESGGTCRSLTEHSKGSVFALGFETEEVGWLIEHLAKAIELKSYMGFNRKYRGKSRVYLMEVCFNNHGRFIRLSEFASKRKSTFLEIPEGEQGKGWEQLKNVISSMLVVPSSNIVEKERQWMQGWKHKIQTCGSYVPVLCECSQRGRTEERRPCSNREMDESYGLWVSRIFC